MLDMRDLGLLPVLLGGGAGVKQTILRRSESGESMADWMEIRNEYVTSSVSQRELARKHNVSQASINRRCKAEKWDESRESYRCKVIQKTERAASDAQVDRVTQLIAAGEESAKLLMTRLEQMAASGKIKTYEVKAITESLKHLRDLNKSDGGSDGDKYQKVRDLLGGVPDALE